MECHIEQIFLGIVWPGTFGKNKLRRERFDLHDF